MSNTKLSLLMIALALAYAIICLITKSSLYLLFVVIGLCTGLAGVVKNRWIFLMFGLVSLAAMSWLLISIIKLVF